MYGFDHSVYDHASNHDRYVTELKVGFLEQGIYVCSVSTNFECFLKKIIPSKNQSFLNDTKLQRTLKPSFPPLSILSRVLQYVHQY